MATSDPTANPNESNAAPQEKRKAWQGLLPYLGGIVAFISLIGASTVFIISKSIEIRKQISWEDKVVVVAFDTDQGLAFFNAGDGEVFLSHAYIESAFWTKTIQINSAVKPNEFFSIPPHYAEPPNDQLNFIVSGVSDEQWRRILCCVNKKRFVALSQTDPFMVQYRLSLGDTLRTLPAKGQLVYASSKEEGKQIMMPIDVELIVMLSKEELDKARADSSVLPPSSAPQGQ